MNVNEFENKDFEQNEAEKEINTDAAENFVPEEEKVKLKQESVTLNAEENIILNTESDVSNAEKTLLYTENAVLHAQETPKNELGAKNTDEKNEPDFFAGERSFKFDRDEEKRYRKSTGGLWKTVGIISLAVIMAFSGAFFGMVWVCQTAILGDSDFFDAIILSNSGVTVNRVDVDYISGEYQPTDSITLAEKILKYTVSIEARLFNEETGEYSDPSNGSGVIIDYNETTGYATVVTNQHVAYGSNHFRVIMYDDAVYSGELLHLDEIYDLAVLRIKTDKAVECATVADSSKTVYGQEVAVCGNPLGYNSSVSFGYISCPSRYSASEDVDYIQIDVSVNPGNSGGGLYDTQGNLIGIVVSKASGTNVDGIGFAIPSNRMLETVNDLMQYGYVKGRPALGVTVATVNVSSWDHFNSGELAGYLEEQKYGVYIISTKHEGKLFKGDRIISIDGPKLSKPITLTTKEQVSAAVLKHKAGDKLTLKIERLAENGSFVEVSVEITLGERDWADENYTG